MDDFEDYMKWPQHKIDALFEEMFGTDYKKLVDFRDEIENEIARREVEEADDIYDMCEDKTYLAEELLREIGINV